MYLFAFLKSHLYLATFLSNLRVLTVRTLQLALFLSDPISARYLPLSLTTNRPTILASFIPLNPLRTPFTGCVPILRLSYVLTIFLD